VRFDEWDNEPPVPVIVTVYEPAVPEQDSVDVPDVPRMMLAGDSVQLRPVEGDIVLVRATIPVNP
jgi:hypothetical protein